MGELTNKVALVTGGGRGIGARVARELADAVAAARGRQASRPVVASS